MWTLSWGLVVYINVPWNVQPVNTMDLPIAQHQTCRTFTRNLWPFPFSSDMFDPYQLWGVKVWTLTEPLMKADFTSHGSNYPSYVVLIMVNWAFVSSSPAALVVALVCWAHGQRYLLVLVFGFFFSSLRFLHRAIGVKLSVHPLLVWVPLVNSLHLFIRSDCGRMDSKAFFLRPFLADYRSSLDGISQRSPFCEAWLISADASYEHWYQSAWVSFFSSSIQLALNHISNLIPLIPLWIFNWRVQYWHKK